MSLTRTPGHLCSDLICPEQARDISHHRPKTLLNFFIWVSDTLSLLTPPPNPNLNKQHLFPLSICHFPPSSFYFSTPLYPISPPLPLTISPFQGPCRLSLLFTKYSLTKKWDFLLIEDQSGKVPSSKPAPSISRP